MSIFLLNLYTKGNFIGELSGLGLTTSNLGLNPKNVKIRRTSCKIISYIQIDEIDFLAKYIIALLFVWFVTESLDLNNTVET